MTRATNTANWGAFAGALGTFGIGLDASIGHSAARNAVDNNLLPHLVWLALSTYASFEYLHFVKDMKAEGVETALGKLGIRLVEDATMVMAIETGVAAAPLLFEVGGVVCKTLGEALKLVRANPTITKELQSTCTAIERNLPEMEQLVQVLRPTARQSEIDIGVMLGDGYKPQISFKDSSQIRYGSKGSTRPDLISHDLSHCIEVKNYVVSSESGISRLVSDVSAQALKRQAHLPVGMQQHVFIDIRGQSVSGEMHTLIQKRISEKSKGVIKIENIEFLKDFE